MKHIILLFIIITISGCNNGREGTGKNIKKDLGNKVSFTISNELIIKVDSNCNNYPESFQIISDNNQKFLSVYDGVSDGISLYNMKTSVKEKFIQIEREGPFGIGSVAFHGFFIHNMDSIFVASGQNISIINNVGKVFYKCTVPSFLNNRSSGMPFIACDKQACFLNNKLYVSLFTDKNSFDKNSFTSGTTKGMAVIDLNTKKVEYSVDYPLPYQEGIYGPNFLFSYQTFNKLNKSILVSFPAFENIIKFDLIETTLINIETVGSKYFNKIPPMDKVENSYDYYTRFYIQTPSYAGIYFDSKNRFYYRIALQKRNNDEYLEGKFWKKSSVLIYDDEFNKLGEFDLNEKYNNSLIAIDNGILYLIKESKNENQMALELLTPIKL